MTSHPPHGINDVDYEAIEAAVTETVRGRWFLNEFARRNRTTEMRQLMAAMGRLETMVASNQSQQALPSADPSIRLLIQRIKDIAGQMDGLARDMRDAGVDERFCDAADLQARAVAGMMRNTVPARPAPAEALPRVSSRTTPPVAAQAPVQPPEPALVVSRVEEPMAPPVESFATPREQPADAPIAPAQDPRRAALSGFDDLPLAKKLALFS